MIYALLIVDQSGSLIYSWRYERAPKEIIKKFEPELIGSFITAVLQFGAEILNAPRYIDMGVAGTAIVNIIVGKQKLIAVAIADKDDSPRAIERFVADFKRRAEGILVTILSVSSMGLIILTGDVVRLLDKAIEESLKAHIRLLPKIRSDDLRATVFGFFVSTPIYLFSSMVVALLIIDLTMWMNLDLEQANALFMIAWIFYVLIMGFFSGWLTCRSKSAFVSAVLAYLASWLIYVLFNPPGIMVVIGGSFYSVMAGISAYSVAAYFDDIALIKKL